MDNTNLKHSKSKNNYNIRHKRYYTRSMDEITGCNEVEKYYNMGLCFLVKARFEEAYENFDNGIGKFYEIYEDKNSNKEELEKSLKICLEICDYMWKTKDINYSNLPKNSLNFLNYCKYRKEKQEEIEKLKLQERLEIEKQEEEERKKLEEEKNKNFAKKQNIQSKTNIRSTKANELLKEFNKNKIKEREMKKSYEQLYNSFVCSRAFE